MHPTNWTCCVEGQQTPWWVWFIVGALALGMVICSLIWIVWMWRCGGSRQADATPDALAAPGTQGYPDVWERASVVSSPPPTRPRDVPRPESVEEVAAWAGSENLRSTYLVRAPVFWVVLPLVALGYLIWGTITDPGDGWTGDLLADDSRSAPWNFWLVWVGVGIWLLITVGVLVFRLSGLREVRAEDEWVAEHGVAYSIHRASMNYDDGEASWATYIALDHRLDDRQAARIHDAFEAWLRVEGLPPSRSAPISSATQFGAEAEGGYFILHLPVPQATGATTEHRWMLLTKPRPGDSDVIVTPVPVGKRFQRMRVGARRKAARRGWSDREPANAPQRA